WHDVAIVGVQPELVELERRGEPGVEPDRAGFGLAELGPRRRRQQRPDETVRLRRTLPANQIDARRDVAPLIGGAHLQHAGVALEQLEEVARLQEEIAELRV